jgi:alkylation response protein AidB-like acyl-CoA dehydrogenase
MSFLLNDEQRLLADSARDFLSQRAPVAAQRALRDRAAPLGFDPDVWQQVVELGWTAAVVPEPQGGLAVGYAGLGAVFEQVGRHLSALPLLSNLLCSELLLHCGNDRAIARWMPGWMAGDARAALAVDESRGHDRAALAAPATTARREVGGWVLDGEKCFVIDGVGAHQLLVVASTQAGTPAGTPADQGRAPAAVAVPGLALFVVDVARPGVTVQATRLADCRNHARVHLQGVRVADDALLVRGPAACQALESALDRARICLAAEGLGLVREAFERTVAYLKERVQFDVPIGSFQALQHRVARLYTEIELLDSAVRAALAGVDADAADLALLASLAKARSADLCVRVLNEAVQLHGGIGVTDEFDLGLFLKRARVLQASLGDARFHVDRYARLKGF